MRIGLLLCDLIHYCQLKYIRHLLRQPLTEALCMYLPVIADEVLMITQTWTTYEQSLFDGKLYCKNDTLGQRFLTFSRSRTPREIHDHSPNPSSLAHNFDMGTNGNKYFCTRTVNG